jgi:hypothetical protein
MTRYGQKAIKFAVKFAFMSGLAGLKATGPGAQSETSITLGASTPDQTRQNLAAAWEFLDAKGVGSYFAPKQRRPT